MSNSPNKKPQFELVKRNKLNKHLNEIDQNKWYSNYGPLYNKIKID